MALKIATKQDIPEISKRIKDATNGIIDMEGDDNILNNSICVIYEEKENAVLRLVWDDPSWYIQHLWGPPQVWIEMIKKVVRELIRRGQGNAAVRWREGHKGDILTIIPGVADRFHLRKVKKENRAFWEITPKEALKIIKDW